MFRIWNKNTHEVEQLLDDADVESRVSAVPAHDRRADTRTPSRIRIKMRITHPAGNSTTREVMTRTLGPMGLSFIHPGYLHVGTQCRTQLITQDNAWIDIRGSVCHCRHLVGCVHEAGMQFVRRIDVTQILPSMLRGSVLVVEDVAMMSRLIKHHLEKSGLTATIADDGGQALRLLREQDYDIILMDEVLPDMYGHDIVQQLRDEGITTPVISLTACTDEETRNICRNAGCNAILSKPIEHQALLDAIRTYLTSEELISSNYADDPDMGDVITQFVNELPWRLQAIREAVERNDARSTAKACAELRVLASPSGGCGYEPISDAAGSMEKHVRSDTPDWSAVMDQLQTLTRIIGRVRPPSGTDVLSGMNC